MYNPEKLKLEKPFEPALPLEVEPVRDSVTKEILQAKYDSESLEIGCEQRDKLRNLQALADPKYNIFLQDIPKKFLRKLLENNNNVTWAAKTLDQLIIELAEKPELAELYKKVILDNDMEVLRDKSKAQLKNLQDIYYKGLLGRLNLKKRKKIATFREYITTLQPIRSDARGAELTSFKSPRELEKSMPDFSGPNSYGAQDILVHADNFVYGSFDKIRHHMAEARPYKLNEEQITGRTQLLMQDIANLQNRVTTGDLMEQYLANLFDYETGKDILATYLAIIFKDPEEAEAFFSANNSPMQAQRWDEGDLLYYPSPKVIKSLFANDDAIRKSIREQEEMGKKRVLEIKSTMKDLLQKTHIEPPFSLELRVSENAEIIKA